MEGLVDHYIVSMYKIEKEISDNVTIRDNEKIVLNEDPDEDLDNAINQLFEQKSKI